jgi:3-methyladenine DNA glycosylase AlkD
MVLTPSLRRSEDLTDFSTFRRYDFSSLSVGIGDLLQAQLPVHSRCGFCQRGLFGSSLPRRGSLRLLRTSPSSATVSVATRVTRWRLRLRHLKGPVFSVHKVFVKTCFQIDSRNRDNAKQNAETNPCRVHGLSFKIEAMNAPPPPLRTLAQPGQAKLLTRFFKTGPGQYGEGDRFLGIRMPQLRAYVKDYRESLTPARQKNLLRSRYHEERMVGLLIWTAAIKKASPDEQDRIARAFLKFRGAANNWDLIDVNVPDILGPSLYREAPFMIRAFSTLLRSKNLWDRRIAILSTFFAIRRGNHQFALRACAAVLKDPEDLIHKASGWMLREVGKRDRSALRDFLNPHSRKMPRTMLRYAIERLPEPERKQWLKMERSVEV